jgi:hypothetical protein
MDYEALLSHPQATRYVAEFMLQTGLLGQFRHCEVEPEPPEDDETTGMDRRRRRCVYGKMKPAAAERL